MSHSTRPSPKGNRQKPEKPRPDFPLFPHATGRWAKKIRGRMCYFGPWDDPDGALTKYLEQKDDLYAGRKPRTAADLFALRDLVNRFLTHKRHLVDTQEITNRTFAEYYATCEMLVKAFGAIRPVDDLRTDDFESLRGKLARTLGPVRLGNEIQRVRSVFKYGFDAGILDRPVRFGPGFKRPNKKTLRLHRAAQGPRMLEADAIRALLGKAGPQLRAMILLGVNCGFGNADVAAVPYSAIDLDGGWVNFPRPKTGIARRCPLWPETIEAIRKVRARRPEPKEPEHGALVFITKYGQPWIKVSCAEQEDGTLKTTTDDAVSKEMAKRLKELKLARKGLSFYALRHVFETIGGEARDQVAVDHIMGHARDDMATTYRERISDERLRVVTNHVRAWLFPKKANAKKARKSAG